MTVAGDGTPLETLRVGGKRALADALACIERSATADETIGLLDAAYHGARGHVIGITGPPGVGKSTLLGALIRIYRRRGETVGVIAIDPSSRHSGGALLGDRVRIDTDPLDQGVFVRSMAARDRLGGLASMTAAAVVLMRAVHDRVFVETVGVGQSETDIAAVADSVLLCVQPGSGDSLQYMKAGIAEIPDIAVVTKADLGAIAHQTRRDLETALATTGVTTGRDAWQAPVLAVSSTDDQDIVVLVDAIERHWTFLVSGTLRDRRHAQAEAWLVSAIRDGYGRDGLERANSMFGGCRLGRDQSPFRRLDILMSLLSGASPGD